VTLMVNQVMLTQIIVYRSLLIRFRRYYDCDGYTCVWASVGT